MSTNDNDFEQELALWETASKSPDPNLTIQYLDKYPSGNFNQLAEARLDELLAKRGEKKVAIKNSSANPFTKGTVSGIGDYAVGDTYTYQDSDLISDAIIAEYTEVVTQVTDFQIVFNDGERILDRLGNEVKTKHPRFLSPVQFFPVEYSVGGKWRTNYRWENGLGKPSDVEADFRIIGRELKQMPFGGFNAYSVDSYGSVIGAGKIMIKYWLDPERCHRPLVYEFLTQSRTGRMGVAQKTTLLSFKQRRGLRTSFA